MPKKNSGGTEFDPSVVGRLACPACHGDLRLEALSSDALNFVTPSSGGSSRLVCTACGRAYPIVDGIPVMIAERVAESLP